MTPLPAAGKRSVRPPEYDLSTTLMFTRAGYTCSRANSTVSWPFTLSTEAAAGAGAASAPRRVRDACEARVLARRKTRGFGDLSGDAGRRDMGARGSRCLPAGTSREGRRLYRL